MCVLQIDWQPPTQLIVEFGSENREDMSKQVYSQQVSPPVPDLLRSVYELRNVLAGEPTWLFRVSDRTKRIRVRPLEKNNVSIEILNTVSEAGKPEASLTSTRETICRTVLDGARAYHAHVCNNDQQVLDDHCHCLELSVGITDAECRLAHYREHGTQDGYEPTFERWQLEQFARYCTERERLRNVLAETDELRDLVRDLTTSDDDEYVMSCYQNLLEIHPELRTPTVEELTQTPDERARESLTAALWTDVPNRANVLRALQEVADDGVIDDCAHILAHYSDTVEATEVCLVAADLLSSVDLSVQFNQREQNRIVSKIQKAYDAAEASQLRTKLGELLDELDAD